MEKPPFAPGERVIVHIEVCDNAEVHRGEFIKLDETGLMIQRRPTREIIYFPRERIVMVAGVR